MSIRNIIFDMGGVLIRFEPDLFIRRLGVSPEDGLLLRNGVFRSPLWPALDRGTLCEDEAFEAMCRKLPERLHTAARELIYRWDEPLLPVPGMAELVSRLKALGYPLYLLSNASRRQHEYWPRVPGSDLFDATLISADEILVKPEPEIYRLLFRRFGLNPGECVFIDDNPVNIEAAGFCGMHGCVFNDDVPALRRDLRELGVPVL